MKRGIYSRNNTVKLYGGTIVRFCPNPTWRGSAWEGADIRWDNEGGSQIISLFETKGEEGSYRSIPQSIRENLIQKLKEISKEPFASMIRD